MSAELKEYFASRCRGVTEDYLPRECFADRFGLKLRALQDLEQGRALPSRAMLLLLTAIEMDPDFMRDVAKEAESDLAMLDRVRLNRNKIEENSKGQRAQPPAAVAGTPCVVDES